jgi:hypothetical protein
MHGVFLDANSNALVAVVEVALYKGISHCCLQFDLYECAEQSNRGLHIVL